VYVSGIDSCKRLSVSFSIENILYKVSVHFLDSNAELGIKRSYAQKEQLDLKLIPTSRIRRKKVNETKIIIASSKEIHGSFF
jgi:hypothetical protein